MRTGTSRVVARRERPARWAVAGGTVLVTTGLVTAGCASTAQTARADAIAAVRADARSLQEHFADAARGTSGGAQVEAVRAVLSIPSLTAARDAHGVVVTGALVADAYAGGGLTYEGFIARLCLRFTVAQHTGETDVADARCPPRVDVEAPADETVTLE